MRAEGKWNGERAETDRLLAVRTLIHGRVEKLTKEKEILQHALDHVKNLLLFEESMKGEG